VQELKAWVGFGVAYLAHRPALDMPLFLRFTVVVFVSGCTRAVHKDDGDGPVSVFAVWPDPGATEGHADPSAPSSCVVHRRSYGESFHGAGGRYVNLADWYGSAFVLCSGRYVHHILIVGNEPVSQCALVFAPEARVEHADYVGVESVEVVDVCIGQQASLFVVFKPAAHAVCIMYPTQNLPWLSLAAWRFPNPLLREGFVGSCRGLPWWCSKGCHVEDGQSGRVVHTYSSGIGVSSATLDG
jgi:hypothetical protein